MLLPLLVGLTACGSSSPARSPAPAGRAEPSAGHARACDRVASPRGDNRAAGTAAHPWRGAQRLANGLRPGMTGCLRAGTYRGGGSAGYVLRFTHGRVRVRSFPGERARLAGVVYVRRGANHVTLTGVDIEDS
ncbi:MAG: hypothetical protein QOI80_1881, partial [Solirubrobacteraceae bacterium]|nr:hypothetical protein [Solirubrobacteraceae bacterium]